MEFNAEEFLEEIWWMEFDKLKKPEVLDHKVLFGDDPENAVKLKQLDTHTIGNWNQQKCKSKRKKENKGLKGRSELGWRK